MTPSPVTTPSPGRFRLPSPLPRTFLLRAGPVVLLSAGLAACNPAQTAAPKSEPERPVLVAPVRFEPQSPARSFVAVIRPRVEVDQGFRVPGKVVKRLVDVGQAVKAGDRLAVLDDTDLRLQVEQAEADVRALATAMTQAEAEEGRVVNLRKQGWSTDSTFEKQRATTDEIRARQEKAARALALARNALDYATLRADADGVVTAALVEPGQVVAAGQAALRIARAGETEAVVAIPETLVGRIGSAQTTLSLWSAPDRHYAATLRELSPVADPATRTYTARFSLPDADAAVKLGMTATLTAAEPAARSVARLPLSALFNQGQGPSVWTVDAEGVLALRPVEVGGYESRDVLVKAGVAEGDRVVALGVQKLEAGRKVRVVRDLGL